jgi:hypothetical protein
MAMLLTARLKPCPSRESFSAACLASGLFAISLLFANACFEEVNKLTAAESAIAQRREDLERFEFMMGAERGRLAVTLDMLTDALILIGQHGVYCTSTRNPAKPALDLEAVLAEVGGAKELIQSVMEQLQLKNERATERL